MKTIISLTAAFLLTVPISAFCETDLQPQGSAEVREQFIDLDGDGISDNARDLDNDGIPDSFGNSHSDAASDEGVAPVELLASTMNADMNMDGVFGQAMTVSAKEPNFMAYSSREFSARDLTQDRGGFDSENRSDAGASRGKVCVGGVCF